MVVVDVAKTKEILTLEKLANLLRPCEEFDEEQYEISKKNAYSFLGVNLFTKYLIVDFCVGSGYSSPIIKIKGKANYDGDAMAHDFILSETARRLAEKHQVRLERGSFRYCTVDDGIDKLKIAIRGVEHAQRTLNSLIEKKINELLNTV